jgi:hypothetical protein
VSVLLDEGKEITVAVKDITQAQTGQT